MTATATSVLTLADGTVAATYDPAFLDERAADEMTNALALHREAFKNGFMIVGDVWVKTPRLVAEFGDEAHLFPDTGPNRAWPTEVRALRDVLVERCGEPFNYAIANLYRDGRDFTGWHADKMDVHHPGASIAMVSLGAARRFEFRDARTGEVAASVEVAHGSLLVMSPASQLGYEHSLRPAPGLSDARLSLTFRRVLPTASDGTCSCGAEDPEAAP